MLPLRDNIPTRRFPILTVAILVANVGVWLLYQGGGTEPRFSASLVEASYRPCEVTDICPTVGQPWLVTAFTSMFMHGSWLHLIGNMLFLWVFGNNIEDTLGRVRFLVFYLVGGLAATALQSFVTLNWGTAEEAGIPNVGASGAIAAVLGGYILLHPGATVMTWIAPFFFLPLPAFLLLGIWFVFQLVAGGIAFTHPQEGGGVAYFAHIGGFVFGLLAVRPFAVHRPVRHKSW